MKGLNFTLLLSFVLMLGACCSKKGTCPALQFESFQLRNFDDEEVLDSVNLIRYDPNSNFTRGIDTAYMKAERTDDSTIFLLKTAELSLDYNYGVQVMKYGKKLYRIGSFTGEKVSCGKCFMRPNNQFGYILSGYSVNTRHQDYDNIIVIWK